MYFSFFPASQATIGTTTINNYEMISTEPSLPEDKEGN